MAIKLSTGKVAFPIEFDNGDVQNIYFNPSDPELATRLMSAKDKIAEKVNNLNFEDFELSNSGEPITIDEIDDVQNLSEEQLKKITERAKLISKVVTETKKIICEELDAAFDSDISSVVFKYCSPLAIVDGNYFILNFLEAIAPELRTYIENANKDAEKKMQKHIGKYQKK